jgi:hypothetical protein
MLSVLEWVVLRPRAEHVAIDRQFAHGSAVDPWRSFRFTIPGSA